MTFYTSNCTFCSASNLQIYDRISTFISALLIVNFMQVRDFQKAAVVRLYLRIQVSVCFLFISHRQQYFITTAFSAAAANVQYVQFHNYKNTKKDTFKCITSSKTEHNIISPVQLLWFIYIVFLRNDKHMPR